MSFTILGVKRQLTILRYCACFGGSMNITLGESSRCTCVPVRRSRRPERMAISREEKRRGCVEMNLMSSYFVMTQKSPSSYQCTGSSARRRRYVA